MPAGRKKGQVSKSPYRWDAKRQLMWNSMRIFGQFEASELAATCECSLDAARTWAGILKKFGYLKVVKNGRYGPLGHYPTFVLLKNTGPYAPKYWIKQNKLYDINKKQVIEVTDVMASSTQKCSREGISEQGRATDWLQQNNSQLSAEQQVSAKNGCNKNSCTKSVSANTTVPNSGRDQRGVVSKRTTATVFSDQPSAGRTIQCVQEMHTPGAMQ